MRSRNSRNLQQSDLLEDRFDSWVVECATLSFNSFCSNAAKQVAPFCCLLYFSLLCFSKTRELWSSKANWRLHFLLRSIILVPGEQRPFDLPRQDFCTVGRLKGLCSQGIILADLLGNRTLLKQVQKVMVCDLWLVDFDPFCVFLCFKVHCLWS